ncbi:MAG: hypothetical protein GY851_15415 [bacterium]|nr:hypothetical protein [bacterium]
MNTDSENSCEDREPAGSGSVGGSARAIVVDPHGGGGAIQRAIDQAPEGGCIRVPAGTYHETLTIRKPLELMGDGPGPTVVHGLRAGCALVDAEHAVLRGLSLVASEEQPGQNGQAVEIRRGRVEVVACTLRAQSGACAVFRGAASNATFRDCVIEGGDIGILADGQAWGDVADCRILGARSAGIVVSGDSAPRFLRCAVERCAGAGVMVFGASDPRFEKCTVVGCGGISVDVSDGSAPIFTRCRIEDGPLLGIHLHEGALGEFDRCEVRAHGKANVAVSRDASPVFRGCAIANGRTVGVFVFDGGTAALEQCAIESNARDGIRVTDGSCRLADCSVAQNGRYGLAASGHARADTSGCTFARNALGALSATGDAVVSGHSRFEG